MKNPEQTVGNMADKLKTAFIGSVDEPKAIRMSRQASTPEKRRDKSYLTSQQYVVNACTSIPV